MYAIFGDSYISRLEEFTRRTSYSNGCHKYRFYGVPGMSTKRKIWDKFNEMLADRPTYVFLNLGGNDILDKCEVNDIVSNLGKIVNLLKSNGVKRVFVSGIIERGSFLNWTGMNKSRFNKVRRSVNVKLRLKYGDDFVNMCKKIKFPRHYDRDLIHPGKKEGGLKILSFVINRCFTGLHTER